MVKSKKGLGTYSNNGLGSFEIQFSEEDLAYARNRVETDKAEIAIDYNEKINRLDYYIKNNIGAIPSTEDFVKWFFDKQKIKHTGNNLLKINEEEIFFMAEEYVKILDKKRIGDKTEPLKLNYGEYNNEVLKIIYDNLFPEKIDVNFDEFENLFHFKKAYEKLIRWKGTETEFVNLFTSLKFENKNLLLSLSTYFINSTGKKFTAKQLSVSKSKSTEANYHGKKNIEMILMLIKDIKS